MLEEFLRSRLGEILQSVGLGRTPFDQLPEGLKDGATYGVLDSVRFQRQFLDSYGVDPLAHAQKQAGHISSTVSRTFSISENAFLMDQSNVTVGGMERVLGAFQINERWNAIQDVCRSTGLGLPDIKGEFRNIAERRHRAAHWAPAQIGLPELESMGNVVCSLALAWDFVLSQALLLIMAADPAYLKGIKLSSASIEWYFSEPHGSGGVVMLGRAESARRVEVSSAQLADHTGQVLARRHSRFFVAKNARGLPEQWSTHPVD